MSPRVRFRAVFPSVASTLALVFVNLALRAEPSTAAEIRFDNDRLWVRTSREQSVESLLAEVTEATGVQFQVAPELARGRIDLEIDGLALERGLHALAAAIPDAGGHATAYVSGRVSSVSVVALSETPLSGAPAAEDSAEVVVLTRPAPSSAEHREQKAHMIRSGLPPQTAQRYIDLLTEARKIERTPGAVPSERFLESRARLMGEVARARAKTLAIDAAREQGRALP